MMGVELFKILNNLTTTFYSYIISSHPINLVLVYLSMYSLFAGYVYQLEDILANVDTGQQPYISTRVHYRKGRWKHRLGSHRTPRPLFHLRSQKHLQNNIRYTDISSGISRHCTWDSLYQWKSLLQPSYEDIFNRNCLKYPHLP